MTDQADTIVLAATYRSGAVSRTSFCEHNE